MRTAIAASRRSRKRTHRRLLVPGALLLLGALAAPGTASAESYRLNETSTDSRVYSVRQRMTVEGTLKAPRPEGKSLSLSMRGESTHAFLERRLSGTGRNAKALRSLRHYRSARTQVRVGRSQSDKRLASDRRLLVVQGTETGLLPYSPAGPLDHAEVDLLHMPGDVLALRAFLPDGKVAVGATWTPPNWAVLLVSGIDAVAKSDVTCKLKSAGKKTAVVTVTGKAEGARDGAPSTIRLSGEFTYDLGRGYIASASLKQAEKTDAGPVSPALDVQAAITVERSLAENPGPLSAEAAGRISLEPKPELLLQRFEPSAGVQFLIDRDWRVVFADKGVAILRLLDRGNLVAQVNIKMLPKAAAGKHVTERQFQDDVRKKLGPRLSSIVRADVLKPKQGPSDGRFLYRVTADGSENGIDMRWAYYLCAAPDGRQASLVFAVEKKLVKQLDERDAAFVLGVRFAKPAGR